MRLPDSAHTDRPWRIHEFTEDFILEDVWSLNTPGGKDELDRLVRQFTSDDDAEISAVVTRFLFFVRRKLGGLLGLDEDRAGFGRRVLSLRNRLPQDLADGPRGPDMQVVPFYSVYQTDTEWVAELANKTVHALIHIGWVKDDTGDGYHGQMAALVKPAGLLGTAYINGIKPIRRALVVPSLLRSIAKNWPRYA